MRFGNLLLPGTTAPEMQTDRNPRTWFKTDEQEHCPACGRHDAVRTSTGSTYCRSCGEVVAGDRSTVVPDEAA